MCAHMINKAYNKWTSSPEMVNLAQRTMSVGQVPFPAITICSGNKVRRSIFNFTHAYHEFFENMTEMKEDEYVPKFKFKINK